MTKQSNIETVYRYRILRHDEMPESRKAEYRALGINPDNNWSLIWSFYDRKDAEDQLLKCKNNAYVWETYKLVDAGQTDKIASSVWF